MSRLEELVEELCPNGVEYNTIGEVTSIKRGDRITKKDLVENGAFKVVSGGVEPMGYYDKYNREANTITISSYGYAGYVNYIKERFWANDVCLCVYPCELLNNKYLYYVLKNTEAYFFTKTTKAIPDHIPTEIILTTNIPVPPLDIQNEIVKILDSFTELTAELTAELKDRKKQYEYYRNVVLKDIDADEYSLGDVCNFIRGPFGGSLKKECFVPKGYAVYEQQHAIYENLDFRYYITQEKYDELKRFNVVPGDLIVSCSGTIGRVFIIPDKAPEGIINQALLKLTPSDKVDAKYLKYFFENTITSELNSSARGGAIKNVPSVSELKQIKIMLPSIQKQKEIVAKLDCFQEMCSDIFAGLPAEIEARQKQYGYYRDKLLSFKELA